MLKTLLSNWELYQTKKETGFLRVSTRENHPPSYINLRTCRDKRILGRLEQLLKKLLRERGEEYVIVPWISAPFGAVRGYGVYTRKEAEEYGKLSKAERWGFPRFGRIYDLAWLRRSK